MSGLLRELLCTLSYRWGNRGREKKGLGLDCTPPKQQGWDLKPGSLQGLLSPQSSVLWYSTQFWAATGPVILDITLFACSMPVCTQGICFKPGIAEGFLYSPRHTDTQLTLQGAREAWPRRRQAGRPGGAKQEVQAWCLLGH